METKQPVPITNNDNKQQNDPTTLLNNNSKDNAKINPNDTDVQTIIPDNNDSEIIQDIDKILVEMIKTKKLLTQKQITLIHSHIDINMKDHDIYERQIRELNLTNKNLTKNLNTDAEKQKEIRANILKNKKLIKSKYVLKSIAKEKCNKYRNILNRDKVRNRLTNNPLRTKYLNNIDQEGSDVSEIIKKRKEECKKKRIEMVNKDKKVKRGNQTTVPIMSLPKLRKHTNISMATRNFKKVLRKALNCIDSARFHYKSALQFTDLIYFISKKKYNNMSDEEVTQHFKNQKIAMVTSKSFQNKRRKVPWQDYKLLFEFISDYIVKDIEKYNTREIICEKINSVDGTTLNFLKQLLGGDFALDKNERYLKATLNTMYDVTNQIPISVLLEGSPKEREMFMKQFDETFAGSIILGDGHYFGKEVHETLSDNNIHYIMKISAAFSLYKEHKGNSGESVIVDYGTHKIRLLKVSLGKHQVLYGTNMIDAEKYSDKFISETYDQRWFIEEFYKILKCILNADEDKSLSYDEVMQNIYTQLICVTIERYMEMIGKLYLKTKKDTIHHAVNKKTAFMCVSNDLLYKLLYKNLGRKKVIESIHEMIFDIINNVINIVDGRHNQRCRKLPNTGYVNEGIQ